MRKYLILPTLFVLLFFYACEKNQTEEQEKIIPVLNTVQLNNLNDTLTIVFSEPVFLDVSATTSPDASVFEITHEMEHNVSLQVQQVIQNDNNLYEYQLVLKQTGYLFGGENFTLRFLKQIYSSSGGEFDISSTRIFTTNTIGVFGQWKAYDISKRLQDLNYDSELYITFNKDYTYYIQGAVNGNNFNNKGRFTQKSTIFGTLWEIGLLQTESNGSATQITSRGIFSVRQNNFVPELWIEVVQTDPEISGLTPPSAQEGFGSTTDGAYGLDNVQKYYLR